MRFVTTWMLLAALGFSAVGCVAQRERDDLQSLYRQSQEQVVDLQAQLEEAEARLSALRDREDRGAGAQEEIDRLRAERDELLDALADAEEQLRDAGAPAALPTELDDELERLAESNPDLMEYDADRGMIRFRSDFTFDLGSANVRDQAAQSLSQLADILQSDAASPYEVRIVGHTDNVPISNPGTLENHPTNWHLSVHRAISVKDVLEDSGITPRRMNVAGYGEHRPLVPNEPGGTEQNRRVEIFLVQMGQVTEPGARNNRSPQKGQRQQAQSAPQAAPAPENPAAYK